MQLSSETILLLKNASHLNTGIVIHPGNCIHAISASGTVFFEAQTTELFKESLNIFYLPEFLSILDLLSTPTFLPNLEVTDEKIIVKGEKGTATFIQSSPTQIPHMSQGRKIADVEAQAEFVLTQELINTIKATQKTLPNVILECTDGIVNLKICNVKDPTSTVLSFPVSDGLKNFNAICNSESFGVLLKVENGYNMAVTEKYLKLSSQDDQIKYWILLDSLSEF